MLYHLEILNVHTCHQGFVQLKRYRLRHSLYAGGMSKELVRERIEGLRAAAVLLYDPDLDRVVLIEQFRVGALEKGAAAWLLEIAGGIWADGLAAEEVAYREAREEVGCEVLDLIPIQEVWTSPGVLGERVMLYCGRVDATHAGGLHGLDSEGEDIRVVVMDLEEARAALTTGRITTAIAIIALQWLLLNREVVQIRWSGAAR